MRVMLDTNTCIAIIKRKPPQVLKRFNAYKVGEIGISWVTLASNNTREFSRIKGLTVVGWLDSRGQGVVPRSHFSQASG